MTTPTLAAHPGPAEWIGGRIFYRFLDRVLRWFPGLLALLVAAYLGYQGLEVVLEHASAGLRAVWPVLLEAAYGLAVLVLAIVVVFLISRRAAERAVTTLAKRFTWPAPGLEWDREAASIRQFLEHERPPPLAGTVHLLASRCSSPGTPMPPRSRRWRGPTGLRW